MVFFFGGQFFSLDVSIFGIESFAKTGVIVAIRGLAILRSSLLRLWNGVELAFSGRKIDQVWEKKSWPILRFLASFRR